LEDNHSNLPKPKPLSSEKGWGEAINSIIAKWESAKIIVYTLGSFEVFVEGKKLNSKDWGRDKSIQLFQFFLLARNRKALLKDTIVDRLWEDDLDDQGFKVALHGINKALEPDRKSHSETNYLQRNGHTYQLNTDNIFIDSFAFETLIKLGNQLVNDNMKASILAFRTALDFHKGSFLPDRVYEDWSADERERLQLMYLGASIQLAELLLPENPFESIQLCQQALLIDLAWEDAYRIQMLAYLKKGNRPMAIKTYQVCEKVLKEELGIRPLPETRKVYEGILAV
jgi:DNA-binding SARP family transcriptional activator